MTQLLSLYCREFHLEWPDDWPDNIAYPFAINPTNPEMLDKVTESLPKMSNLHVFQMTCPYHLPISLLTSLARQENIKDLRIVDTPLVDFSQVPDHCNFERLTLVPVAEAMRAGEGPFDTKFRELHYFARPYRKRHRQRPNFIAAHQYLFEMGLAQNVKYLQVSTEYLHAIHPLASTTWPQLETLVLTGPTIIINLPSMAQVVAHMPKLSDVRLLLSKRTNHAMSRLPILHGAGFPSHVFSTIRRLSLSNSFEVCNFLRHSSSLERLSIGAVSRHPQIPIAMSNSELQKGLRELEAGGGNTGLKKIRLLTEDELTVDLFKTLRITCPNVDFVEVEVCGYQDKDPGFGWVSNALHSSRLGSQLLILKADYADVLCTFDHLQELRIGITFLGCEERCHNHLDPAECIRWERRNCAIYFASRVPTLRLIGFEYWMRTGTHRKEDRWLDYEIVRLKNGGVSLSELVQTWYPFPEVWERVLWHDPWRSILWFCDTHMPYQTTYYRPASCLVNMMKTTLGDILPRNVEHWNIFLPRQNPDMRDIKWVATNGKNLAVLTTKFWSLMKSYASLQLSILSLHD